MQNPAQLKNSQSSLAAIFWVVAVLFTVLSVLPFFEGNPCSGVWAMAFMSFFLALGCCAIAFIFLCRARKLAQLLTGESLLARWELDEETLHYYAATQKEENAAKNKLIMGLIALFFGLISLAFLFFLESDERAGFLVIMGAILLVVFLACRFLPWYYQRQNMRGDRQILIGEKYAYLNGYFHNWDFPLSGLSRITIIKKPFYGLHLTYYYTDKTFRHTHDLKIPAPAGMNLQPLVDLIRKSN